MKKKLFLIAGLCVSLGSVAQIPVDSLKVMDLEEVVVVSSPKENGKLRQQSLAVSFLTPSDIQNKQITSLKDASAYIPNLIMPDYGSRLTSSIYIRGIGSRINSPAVGMYVDNIPYLDKSAYDISILGVERIDVLRGPQGTLYGKNTMGGLIKVYTRTPFAYQGTDVKLSGSTRDGHRSFSVQHYGKSSDQFAYSVGGYYEGADGFFKNTYLNKKVDSMNGGGLRTRLMYKPLQTLSVDLIVSYDNSDEGGYAYGFYDTTTQKIGEISTNRESSYRRSLLNTGLHIMAEWENLQLNSVTGYQHLNDRLFMDQDYSVQDIFTLEQKQKLDALTQEIILKNKANDDLWQWTSGVFFSHQSLHTSAPVTFYSDGMNMLERTINSYFPESISGMTIGLDFKNDVMPIPADFDTPVNNYAVFHQSALNFGRWTLTLGARLEHERMNNCYNVSVQTPYEFTASYGQFQIPVVETAVAHYIGELKDHYTQFLPKAALQYNINKENNVYITVSKGYRSGGYNLQMISDVAQVGMQNTMYSQIKSGVSEAFMQYHMPQAVVDRIVGAMSTYMVEKEIDIAQTITYKPEVSWNYELGSHFSFLENRLLGDVALFYTRVNDQQIARFVNSGFGRILVNAGKSRSYGVELNFTGRVSSRFTWNGSLGYTHATFSEYDTASEGVEGEDYSGNYIPYVPLYNYALGGDYRIPVRGIIHHVTLGANLTGYGKIYWSEDNSQNQKGYAKLGSHVLLDCGPVSVDFWGKNLTDTRYTVFCFRNGNTANSKFLAQVGKPFQLGVDIRYRF